MLDRMLLASASTEALYVEDVFSTYLWTGSGSSQTITNGIDLTGKGGMVWARRRDGVNNHRLADTARGAGPVLSSNTTDGDLYGSNALTSFTSSGFTTGTGLSTSGATYTSWTFRKAPKFFDVVTYTGNGASFRNIAHNLGVAPGCVIIKRTDSTSNWMATVQASSGYAPIMRLNATNAALSSLSSAGDATFFTAANYNTWLGTGSADDDVNLNGATYVAYLFAHDATADGIIQCGSFTADGSGNATVNLGWEPQSLILKSSTAAENWQIIDNMRGWSQTGFNPLFPNLSNAESSLSGNLAFPTATGFQFNAKTASTTYIYIAIRRGPMKTPTVGTSVFAPLVATTGEAQGTVKSTGFPIDMQILGYRTGGLTYSPQVATRLTGVVTTPTASTSPILTTSSTRAESSPINAVRGWDNTSFQISTYWAGTSSIYWNFRRAPSFFDVVCYTGTGTTSQTVSHNLKVAPELIIVKNRSAVSDWPVGLPVLSTNQGAIFLNGNLPYESSPGYWNNTFPTSSSFTVGSSPNNISGNNYVAYLFASCPGVSKVGKYTGNGSSQTINCGFSSGARFFLVKRSGDIYDWWVYDSARGIVAAADPALRLNTTGAEVTSADAVDADSTGIVVNQEATCGINVSGATYFYLAIA